ncbi:MAG: glycosyltransferase family 1 protein [Planctomycetota bacterium]
MPERLRRTLIDYRPALHNREGTGRVARELVRALGACEDAPELVLFGGALRAPRVAREELGLPEGARLVAPRLPARLAPFVFSALGGIDARFGAGLVHHTQLRELPTRRARTTATVFDLLFLGGGAGRLDPAAARGMEQRLRRLVARTDRVHVPTSYTANELATRVGLDRSRIDVVTLGGEHVLRTEPRVEKVPVEPYLLTVSRLDPRKGHRLALRAFERLVERGFDGRWLVVGPPGYRAEELWSEIAASPCAARIEWRRSVDEGELRALYEGALVFVFPSLAEGFGLPPVEAMWCGTPVVSSRATCLAEVLGDGADTFDPRDEAELLAVLERAISDAAHRTHLAARGRAWAERHSWRACAEATLASWRVTCA